MARDGLIAGFDAAASRCAAPADLRALLAEAARDLGFDHVALLHHASLTRPVPGLLRLDTYPDGWLERLRGAWPSGGDPVHLACARTLGGFAWGGIGGLVALDARAREVFARARRFGIGEGFTVPAHVPGEPAGSCSFAMRAGRALPTRHLLLAEQLGLHAFEAARRLTGRRGGPAPVPHFSRREREALGLVCAGKTDWEIAAILGLARETVRQYVKRARSAYGVATRTQLAVHALRDGLVGYDEAIPPSGGMGRAGPPWFFPDG